MYKRIVVKIGTKVLSRVDGRIEESVLENLVAQIVDLRKEGTEVVLVTSGAVSCGRGLLASSGKAETVADKQVFAAIGQVKLMETYAKLFADHGCLCAQVLVTKEDFRDSEHSENMDRCLSNLLKSGVIPIVNENDVVAIQELIFTDNDELAGLIAQRLQAQALIILTSVRGVLDRSPSDPCAKTIPEIDYEHTIEAEAHITAEKTDIGRGGMTTKFAIAKKMMRSGIVVYIAHGKDENVLHDVVNGQAVCTKFIPLRLSEDIVFEIQQSYELSRNAKTVRVTE